MRQLTRTRRGHIPTLLLFFEGMVLMLTVWFVFISQRGELQNLSAPIVEATASLEREHVYVQTLAPLLVEHALDELRTVSADDFENRFKMTFEQRAEAVHGLKERPTTFFVQVFEHQYTLSEDTGRYVLSFSNVSVRADVDAYAFSRSFPLQVVFNRTDVLSS